MYLLRTILTPLARFRAIWTLLKLSGPSKAVRDVKWSLTYPCKLHIQEVDFIREQLQKLVSLSIWSNLLPVSDTLPLMLATHSTLYICWLPYIPLMLATVHSPHAGYSTTSAWFLCVCDIITLCVAHSPHAGYSTTSAWFLCVCDIAMLCVTL